MKHLQSLASGHSCGLLALPACLWLNLHSIHWSDLRPCCSPLTSLARLISSRLFFLSFLVPPQCTQGTKGLLESATLSPLSTSCPQGKPQTAHTCPDNSPTVISDPSPELSTSCGARHTTSSQGDTSPPRPTKTRSKKSKRAALHSPNPAFDVPATPTSPDAGPSSKAGGHKGASFAPLHWLTRMTASSSEKTGCLKLACCNTVGYKWYEFKMFFIVCWLSESLGSSHYVRGWQSQRCVTVWSICSGNRNTRADWMTIILAVKDAA